MKAEDEWKGFLITCDKNKEKQAIKDAYNFLSQATEKLYYDVQGELLKKQLAEKGQELNLENQLKEINKIENRLFFSVDTNVNCVVFIKINPKYPQLDPHRIVHSLMKQIHEQQAQITRFCHKILPVEKCFKAEHFRMLDAIEELIQGRDNSEVKSWALNFKCRNNSKFNYKEILKETQKIISKYGHFVDIYYPQWMISVQIAHHVMCVSICEKYKQYNEYKLRRKDEKKQPFEKAQKQERKPFKKERIIEKKKQKEEPEEKEKEGQEEKEKEGQEEKEEQEEKKPNRRLLDEKFQVNDDDYDII